MIRRRFLSASAGLLAGTLAGSVPHLSGRNLRLPLGVPQRLAAAGTSRGSQSALTPLLGALAVVPNAAELTSGGVSFANRAAIRALYPEANVQSFTDFEAQHQSIVAYSNAVSGCYPSGVMSTLTTYTLLVPDVFGFESFQVDIDVGAGGPPGNLSYLQGRFDAAGIAGRLAADGYATASHSGTDYFSQREDFAIDFDDPISQLALGHMNRVAVSATRIIPVGGTALIEAAIDAELQLTPTLAADPAFQALADALGDVTSLATVPTAELERSRQQAWIRQVLPDASPLADLTRQQFATWGVLQAPELVALGYTDSGGFVRTMHVAIVYPASDMAALDRAELLKRLEAYVLVVTGEPLLTKYATAVSGRTSISGSRSVLVADIAIVHEAPRGRFWIDMLARRDFLFLLQQPPML